MTLGDVDRVIEPEWINGFSEGVKECVAKTESLEADQPQKNNNDDKDDFKDKHDDGNDEEDDDEEYELNNQERVPLFYMQIHQR